MLIVTAPVLLIPVEVVVPISTSPLDVSLMTAAELTVPI